MTNAAGDDAKVTLRSVFIVFAISLAYLLLSWKLVGYKSDQLVLIGIFSTMYFLSAITRKFITGFAIFIVYWIIFDYMKAFPNYNYNTVHIADLYNLEKRFFGINFNGKLLTPNEYWRLNGNTFLDVTAGIFYLCWIPVPLAFAAFLFFKNRRQFLYFSLTFVLINIIGFVIYYLYPAAPPWYVEYHGFMPILRVIRLGLRNLISISMPVFLNLSMLKDLMFLRLCLRCIHHTRLLFCIMALKTVWVS